MNHNDENLVTLRTKGNKEGLETEPEMIELVGMVQSGQLDRNRAASYLNAETEADKKGGTHPVVVRALLPVWKKS
jgi:hypothetical protein